MRIVIAICIMAAAGVACAQPLDLKPRVVTGQVIMVDDQTIRIGKQLGAKNGTSFRLHPDVKVLIQTEEVIDLGLKKPSPKNALGKLADVKLGQRVTIAYTADMRLIEIVILRPKTKK